MVITRDNIDLDGAVSVPPIDDGRGAVGRIGGVGVAQIRQGSVVCGAAGLAASWATGCRVENRPANATVTMKNVTLARRILPGMMHLLAA